MITLDLIMPEGVKNKRYEKLQRVEEVVTYLNFYKHYKHSPIEVHITGYDDFHKEEVNISFVDIKSPIHYNAVCFEFEAFANSYKEVSDGKRL
jgi:hypothetical protein